MATYMTKPRKALLDFLSKHPHEVFSVSQLIDQLNQEKISTSSLYRNLAELEDLGTIRKISKSGTREAHYQYTSAASCRDKIHFFCKKCEKSYHMSDENAQRWSNQILRESDFLVDRGSTVIYGICKHCKTQER